jgi:hypothetical protein
MCLRIPETSKGQLVVSRRIQGWYFVTTDPDCLDNNVKKSASLHPDLESLYFLHPASGKRVRGFEAIPEIKRLNKTDRKRTQDFYSKVFGIRVTEKVVSHDLLGKWYCHQWDANGRILAIYGVFKECEKCYTTGELSLTVEFNEASRSLVNMSLTPIGITVPLQKRLSEQLAWGGCLLFNETVCDQGLDASTSPPSTTLRWLVPTSILQQSGPRTGVLDGPVLPRRLLVFRGHRILLEVDQSSIPNAGFGVFVSCEPLFSQRGSPSTSFFKLGRGDFIDLGVYAPLSASDKKPEHTLKLKNFLLGCKSLSWQFDMERDTATDGYDKRSFVFDFTEDTTGELQEWSRNSVLPFVNETNAKEKPTVHAYYDPGGSVHYLMGRHDTAFLIPTDGSRVEIKIEYVFQNSLFLFVETFCPHNIYLAATV